MSDLSGTGGVCTERIHLPDSPMVRETQLPSYPFTRDGAASVSVAIDLGEKHFGDGYGVSIHVKLPCGANPTDVASAAEEARSIVEGQMHVTKALAESLFEDLINTPRRGR